VTAAAATSVTAENRPHRALSARTTMLVLIHRRKCFLTNGLFLSYPVEKSRLFLSTGERACLPMDYCLHTLSKRWLFLSTGESAFLPMDYFLQYLVETMVCFSHRRKVFLPLDFLHYLVERMVVFIHRRKRFFPMV
jgi:hypothetical protein